MRLKTQTHSSGQSYGKQLLGHGDYYRLIRTVVIIALVLITFRPDAKRQQVFASDQPVSPIELDTMQLPSQQSTLFLPFVTVDPSVVASSCTLNDHEAALIDMMRNSPRQERESVVCNPILAKVARERAEDMAINDYFAHVNLNGEGPNYLVTAAGFQLPSWYGNAKDANNLESIAAGYQSPEDAWNGWMTSSKHEKHLLGLDKFYADQTEVGVGYFSYPGSEYTNYWVVITAPPQ